MSRGKTGPRIWIATAIVVATAVIAAGCGGGGGIESSGSGPAGQVDASGPVQGKLTISQWPLYIDPGKNGTIAEFEGKTGVDVHYIEDINDNNQFFGKLQPQLAKGQSGGRDLITLSDWLAKQMYDSGYLQKLDYAKLPNVKHNLIPFLRHPTADPNRDFTVPWQSGMTGLIVNTQLAPDVNSICDLFDPKYKGKVDMLTELRDTVPMTLKCMGIDPDHAPRPSGSPPSTRSRTRPTRARSGASQATTTSATSARATSTSSSAGPATRSRCRRTIRTSSS